jgi:hypothetical protein
MDNSGMIFTSLVSFLIFASAFVTGLWIFKAKETGNKLMASYAWFLMLTGGLWFFVGLELFAGWMEKENLFKLFFVTNQLFLFLSGIPLAYYLGLKIFKKERLAKFLGIIYSFSLFLEIFFLFKFGIIEGESTYFAEKFAPNKFAFVLFILILAPLFIGSFYDFLSRAVKWIVKRKITNPYEFFYSLVVAVYLLGGVFDESGIIAGWELVFFRLIFVVTFLTAYLAFYFQRLKKEKLIENL